jgi:hypothetical protein
MQIIHREKISCGSDIIKVEENINDFLLLNPGSIIESMTSATIYGTLIINTYLVTKDDLLEWKYPIKKCKSLSK